MIYGHGWVKDKLLEGHRNMWTVQIGYTLLPHPQGILNPIGNIISPPLFQGIIIHIFSNIHSKAFHPIFHEVVSIKPLTFNSLKGTYVNLKQLHKLYWDHGPCILFLAVNKVKNLFDFCDD